MPAGKEPTEMIRSMTAYGRATAVVHDREFTVEIKSVNNRYFDCSVRLPRTWSFMEGRVKSYLSAAGVSRGKVDVTITEQVLQSTGGVVRLDAAMAESYIAALRELCQQFDLVDDISVMRVAENRELFVVQKADDNLEQLWTDVQQVLSQATTQFLAQREAEGERLKNDIAQKKEAIARIVPQIEELSEKSKAEYHDKLKARLEQALSDQRITIDENRILTECALFADRVAVDEETVRLRSHFDTFDGLLQSDGPVGRNLDFLLQEMNREINTIGSKCNNTEITGLVIAVKGELEKIREQIQNIE